MGSDIVRCGGKVSVVVPAAVSLGGLISFVSRGLVHLLGSQIQ